VGEKDRATEDYVEVFKEQSLDETEARVLVHVAEATEEGKSDSEVINEVAEDLDLEPREARQEYQTALQKLAEYLDILKDDIGSVVDEGRLTKYDLQALEEGIDLDDEGDTN